MNRLLIGLIVVIIGALAGWFAFQGGGQLPKVSLPTAGRSPSPSPAPTSEPSGLYTFTEETVTGVPQATGGAVPKGGATSTGIRQQTTVRYTDQGFQPFTVTVKIGTQVTFVNESASGMWVASAVHPTHQLLPGFDQLKSVSRGGSYTYTFEKVGTWQYHNHVTPERTGVIVVTQ